MIDWVEYNLRILTERVEELSATINKLGNLLTGEDVANLHTVDEVAEWFEKYTDAHACDNPMLYKKRDDFCERRCRNATVRPRDCWKHAIESGWL